MVQKLCKVLARNGHLPNVCKDGLGKEIKLVDEAKCVGNKRVFFALNLVSDGGLPECVQKKEWSQVKLQCEHL